MVNEDRYYDGYHDDHDCSHLNMFHTRDCARENVTARLRGGKISLHHNILHHYFRQTNSVGGSV